jgi:hypothetical protein
MLSQDFKEFVQLLIKNNADYLVVGGYAVGMYGYPRFTGDLDIWLKSSKDNAARVLNALNEFGFASFNITEDDLTKEGNIIQLGYPPLRIDLITQIDGVSFDDCYTNKKIIEVDSLKINFIGYQDLLKNKKASGRLKDMDDLEHLEE